MSLRTHLLLVVALVTGSIFALTFRAIFYTKQAPIPEEEIAKAAEPQIPVMVAKSNLGMGEELTAQNVRFLRCPESGVPWNAIFHYQDVVGRRLIKPVQEGRLISLFDLNDPDSEKEETATFIPPGYQPIPIQIESFGDKQEDYASIKKLIQPQDQLSISVMVESKEFSDEQDDSRPHQRKLVTKPLFDHVGVYKVAHQQRIADNQGSLERLALLYVLLDDQQYSQLKEASLVGNLMLTVAKPANLEEAQPANQETQSIVEQKSVPNDSPEAVRAPQPIVTPARELPSIDSQNKTSPTERVSEENSSSVQKPAAEPNGSEEDKSFVFKTRTPLPPGVPPIRAARKAETSADNQ